MHGLADAAERAGAQIHERTAATGVQRNPDGSFTVATERGPVRAEQVMVATDMGRCMAEVMDGHPFAGAYYRMKDRLT